MAGSIKRILVIFIMLMLVLPLLSGCDPSFIDIFTEIEEDYSGTRTVDISVKTQYLRKGEVILEQNQSLLDKLLEILPQGDVDTYEEEGYTHFTSKIASTRGLFFSSACGITSTSVLATHRTGGLFYRLALWRTLTTNQYPYTPKARLSQ